MEEIVFDANTVLNFVFFDYPFHSQAQQLFADCASRGVLILSPPLWESEADTTNRSRRLRGSLTEDACEAAQTLLDGFPITTLYDPTLRPLARILAETIGQAKVYDATYLALAHSRGCLMWTADSRLFNASQNAGLNFVRFLGVYRTT